MKVVIITQNDPFYLSKNLEYLFKIFPKHSKIIGCVIFKASPFGKSESFFKKIFKTYKIFGLTFFMYYAVNYLINKIFLDRNPRSILKKHNIPEIKIRSSINSKESNEIISSYKPDLLVSILGNQIFKKSIINLAPKGCLNLHSALLPKYRGLMPSFWVLKNNESHTGVSVFYVDEGIDSGEIIVQKKIEINNLSQRELIKKSKKIGMEAIAQSVDLIQKNKVKIIINNDSEKTYFSFPTRDDVLVFKKLGKRFF